MCMNGLVTITSRHLLSRTPGRLYGCTMGPSICNARVMPCVEKTKHDSRSGERTASSMRNSSAAVPLVLAVGACVAHAQRLHVYCSLQLVFTT